MNETAAVPENKDYKRNLALEEFNEVYMAKLKLVKGVVPQHLNPDRAWRMVYAAFDKTPALKQCSVESIINSVVCAATVGLEFNTELGHGWLIPYKGKCSFIPGYRGLIYLAMNSPNVVGVDADLVYATDDFEFQKGSTPYLNHHPDVTAGSERGDWYCGYAIVYHKDGPPRVFVMLRDEIEKQRDIAKEKMADWKFKKSPWSTHPEEMAKKTVVRRVLKLEPLSSEFREAEGLERAVEDDQPQPQHVNAADFKTLSPAQAQEGSEAKNLPSGSPEDALRAAADALGLDPNIMIEEMGNEKRRLILFDSTGKEFYYDLLRVRGLDHANSKLAFIKDEQDTWRSSDVAKLCWIELRQAADEWECESKKLRKSIIQKGTEMKKLRGAAGRERWDSIVKKHQIINTDVTGPVAVGGHDRKKLSACLKELTAVVQDYQRDDAHEALGVSQKDIADLAEAKSL